MEHLDLFAMRERFNDQQIMLCFNGPISRSLIEEIGNALRNYLSAEHAHPSAAMDVFAVYIEMTQNISHYTRLKDWTEQEAGATVVVSRNDNGRYVVSAGNIVDMPDGQQLVEAVEQLARMDKSQLKAAYKEQLRRPPGSGKDQRSRAWPNRHRTQGQRALAGITEKRCRRARLLQPARRDLIQELFT